MRARTEERRRALVLAAAELFTNHGYHRVPMSAIAAHCGTSKATLYGYFRSKEDLLHAVIDHDLAGEPEAAINQLRSAPDLREALIRNAASYLGRCLSPVRIAIMRAIASQPGGSPIGRDFHEAVIRRPWTRLADAFQTMMDQGRLKPADPWVAAMHWKGLVTGDLLERRLMGALAVPDPAEIERRSVAATDTFLALYGPDAR